MTIDFFGRWVKDFPTIWTSLEMYIWILITIWQVRHGLYLVHVFFLPPHKLTSSHCKHFLYSSPSLCTKSWSRINLRSFSFLYLQINPNSKAYVEGIKVGDLIESLNGQKTEGLLHNDVQQLIKIASGELALQLNRFVVIIELKL